MYFLFVWMMSQIFSLKFKITRYNTHITGKCATAHLPIKKERDFIYGKKYQYKRTQQLIN